MRFYGNGIPYLKDDKIYNDGKLIVIEGADGSGRSTHIGFLIYWLGINGYATANVGLRRSNLVSNELSKAKEGNTLGRLTYELFYATDFADQLENVIIPNLKAGAIVLADRYIFTLIARGVARGLEREWLEEIYGIALVPDLIFYLDVDPQILVERNFEEKGRLDYWESGLDIGLSDNIFDSFMAYQEKIRNEFHFMAEKYGFIKVNGNRSVEDVQKDLRNKIVHFLQINDKNNNTNKKSFSFKNIFKKIDFIQK
ncbi:MAG: thymidylate kinase [Candidatus Methanoliparum thermophilum]|uniref:Probable thymidylate kinase n=1 Tax=Methanoliparum thermophilum TaxID=2491083 RepID=A0A520KQW2_METT2|nr:MAG: thymidylate kinase [Candidatus Methanoliparum thermophilum]